MSPDAAPAMMGLPSGAIVIDAMNAPLLYPKRVAHSASPAGESLTVKPSPYDTAWSAVDDPPKSSVLANMPPRNTSPAESTASAGGMKPAVVVPQLFASRTLPLGSYFARNMLFVAGAVGAVSVVAPSCILPLKMPAT